MKKIISTVVLILLCQLTIVDCFGQSISRKVISTAGGTLTGGGNQIDFTIGETAITSLIAGSNQITQGFEQPDEQAQLGTELCYGSKIADLVVDGGVNVKWYLAFFGGKVLSSTTSLVTRTYYFSQTINGVESTRTAFNVIVNPTSIAGSITGASGIICYNSGKFLTLSANHRGTVQWQSAPLLSTGTFGTFTDLTGETGNILDTGNLTATTYFRAVVTNGVCPSKNTAPVKVTVSPPAVAGTNSGDVTVCAYQPISPTVPVAVPNSTIITLTGSTAVSWAWSKSRYSVSTGLWSAWASAGTTTIPELTVNNLKVTTKYKAKAVSGSCSEESGITVVNVTPVAKAGKIISNSSICYGGEITFTSSAYVGDYIEWQFSEVAPATATATDWTVFDTDNNDWAVLSFFDTFPIRYKPPSLYVRAKYTNVSSANCTTVAYSAVKKIMVDDVTVAGTITAGGGPVCQGGSGKVILTGYVGKIEWQYSLDGSEGSYVKNPLYEETGSTGTSALYGIGNKSLNATGASYTIINIESSVYLRAMVKNGQCNIEYTDPVLYIVGAAAEAGTISSTVSGSLCNGTGTKLVLENYTGNTIQWYKREKAGGVKTTTEPIEWIVIPGATKSSLATGNLTTSYDYKAVVSIADGSSVCSGLDDAVYAVTSVDVLPKALAKPIRPVGFDNTIAADITNITRVIKMDTGYIANVFQWQKAPVGDTAPPSTSTLWTDIEGATTDTYVLDSPEEGTNWFRAKIVMDRETGSSHCSAVYSSPISVKWSRTNGVDIFRYIVGQVEAETPFAVVAYPNPFTDNFNLRLTTSSDAKVGISVYDMLGKRIEQREVKPAEISLQRIGEDYPSGIYNIILNQATEIKTLRVIKQ